LTEGLQAIGVYPTQEEIDLFYHRYDTDRSHALSFREIEKAFLPHDLYYCSMVQRRTQTGKVGLHRRDDVFHPDTAVEHRNMWRTFFKVEAQAEQSRQRLHRNPHFNLYDAFNTLDLNSRREFGQTELKRLLSSRGFYLSEKECALIVLKCDKDADSTVDFNEFREEFTPRAAIKI